MAIQNPTSHQKSIFYRQLTVLWICRLVEPISMTILFPFINNMMEHVLPADTPRSRIGSYSGFVESVFSFASFLCMYQWGKLSDSRGRKPVVLCGLVGIAGSLVMLGLSRTYPMVLLARILSGCLCGNASVLRAALGEITTQDSENWAYPLWSIGWDLSIIIGPLVGATLSQPAEQYPGSWIGKNAFLKEFPFFLPCAAAAGYALLCVVLIGFFFEETLPAKVNANEGLQIDSSPSETSPLLDGGKLPVQEVVPDMSILQLLNISAVRTVMISSFFLCFTALSFDAVFVLFTYSPVPLNGLALSHSAIAQCFTLRGILSIVLSLLALPLAQRKLGLATLYRGFSACWIACFALPPVMNALARQDARAGPHGRWISESGSLQRMWWLMSPLMVLYTLGDLAFPLGMIALNVAAPDPSVLGRLNGIYMSTSALARALGPVTIGFIYSVSAQMQSPLVWFVFMAISFVGAVVAWFIRGRPEKDPVPDETLADASAAPSTS